MKNLNFLLFASLAFTVLLASCSVEKRVHLSGYHIEWTSKKHKDKVAAADKLMDSSVEEKEGKHEDKNNDSKKAKVEKVYNSESQVELTASRNSEPETASALSRKIPSLLKKAKSEESTSEIAVEESLRLFPKKGKIATEGEGEGRINPLALAGFICSLVGLLLLFITGWPFLLGTIGIILSIIGLTQFSKDPSKWSGKGFAIAGLAIGILVILLFWVLVIIIAAFVASFI